MYSVGNAPVAQLVEQLPLKEIVVGPIPTGCTEVDSIFRNRYSLGRITMFWKEVRDMTVDAKQIRAFLRQAELRSNPKNLLPAGYNLLRLAREVPQSSDMDLAISELKEWLTEISATERTAS